MEQEQKENLANQYGDHKVQQMVLKKYKMMRNEGTLQSIQDIYAKLPESRIEKQNYSFTFDLIKNDIEEKMIARGKLKKILEGESQKLASIEVKNFKNVTFDNEGTLFGEKLQSGLPIFKSIIYLRYQDNDKWKELIGEQHAFCSDQLKIDFNSTKADINKIKFFLEDDTYLSKLNLQFRSLNEIELKDDIFPYLVEMQKRADVLAKLALYNIYSEEHKKLKQAWKNDQNYQEMLRNQKKMKSDMEPQKSKQDNHEQQEQLLRIQVRKIIMNLEERANIIAHDQFRQLNGQKAVQTKKSLQKLLSQIQAQKNPRNQLKILIAYKQKKTW